MSFADPTHYHAALSGAVAAHAAADGDGAPCSPTPELPLATHRRVMVPRSSPDGCQRMWQSMRVLGTFTNSQLATVTEAAESSIRRYVGRLARAGFLRKVGRHCVGNHVRENVWRLVRNTGPQAPRASPYGVTDLNTSKTYNCDGSEVQVVRSSAAGRKR
jgi:hypothetical protein